MNRILEYALIVLGAWLVVSPFALAHQGTLGFAVDIVAGALVIVLALVGMRSQTVQWNFLTALVVGIALAVWGIVAKIAFPGAGGFNEILVGLLVALLSAVALPFQVTASAGTFYNRGGSELARVTKISEKNGQLLAKSVLLNSMPETIFIRPEELCKVVTLLDAKTLSKLPGLLYQGWKDGRKTAKANAEKAADLKTADAKA